MASNEMLNKIKTELIEPSYYSDIKYNINSKSRWKIISDITEALAYVLFGISGILAYAAGFSDEIWLSFVSGTFNTIGLILLRFSSYAMKESKERTRRVNKIITNLGIKPIVDLTDINENNENHTDIIMNV